MGTKTAKRTDAAGVPILNVAEQLKARGIAAKKAPKTVKLRATQRGHYGINGALADLIEPGTVFPFAVKDFEPVGSHQGRGTITVDGTDYELPSWCEDAATPVRADEDDEDEIEEVSGADDSDDVI